jgi:hypothetical protein
MTDEQLAAMHRLLAEHHRKLAKEAALEQTQGSHFATYVKPSATIKLVSSVGIEIKQEISRLGKSPLPLWVGLSSV